MIYGALGDIEEYRGMLKGLDVLIDWLEENDPAQLEVGSHPILGEKVFANVMSPMTRPEAEAHYETHQRYHDLRWSRSLTRRTTMIWSIPTPRSPAILPTTNSRCSLPASPTCPRSSSRAMAHSRSRRSALSCLPTPTGRSSELLG